MTEAPIQKDIRDYLEWRKCVVLRMNSGKIQDARSFAWIQLHPAGTPDLLIGIPTSHGRIMGWIETKRPVGGILNDDQIRELRKIHQRGDPWLVACSLDEAIKWLDDPTYHGQEKYVTMVTDESRKYISEVKKRRNAKASMSDVNAYSDWLDKNEKN